MHTLTHILKALKHLHTHLYMPIRSHAYIYPCILTYVRTYIHVESCEVSCLKKMALVFAFR